MSEPAEAQLAPTGGHYGGRPSDTGHGGFVNSSGGYSASIPLDLPVARGGLPVPVQVNYGEHTVGAAGLGWDVPLSYIRRDTTFAHRRPIGAAGVDPQAREQVLLVLAGRRLDLVRTASGWVARRDAPDLDIREQGDGTWVVFDGQGWTYRFAAAAPSLVGAGIWHLVSIAGPSGSKVALSYFVDHPSVPGAPDALSIDLTDIQYNADAGGCFKNRIKLFYDNPWPIPLSIAIVGTTTFARIHTMFDVDVYSRSTCAAGDTALRSYAFDYVPDPDTKLPRLSSVVMSGRQGTPESSVKVPIGMYEYGTASNGGQLTYQATSSFQVLNAYLLGMTLDDASSHPAGTFAFSTLQSLLDVTGDGRADFVQGAGVARNLPTGTGGAPHLGTAAGVTDATLGIVPLEKRTTDGHRYDEQPDEVRNNMVFRQAIDVNGDGRVDIIDATEQAGIWAVYLNTPDPADSRNMVLQRRAYSTVALTQRLRAAGLWNGDDFLPVSLRSTMRDHVYTACVVWNSFTKRWDEHEDEGPPGTCPHNGTLVSRGPEKTITLWELADINGDGYPDVVFNSSGIAVSSSLVTFPPPIHPNNTPVPTTRNETTDLGAGNANNVMAMLNVIGVHTTSVSSEPFSAPVVIRANARCGFSRWIATDDSHQQLSCSLVDVNGDGIVDRVEDTAVFLGTGGRASAEFFTAGAVLTLQGPAAAQLNEQKARCAPPATGTTTFVTSQLAGLRDLTGDGIPDYVFLDGAGTWQVAIGSGTSFAAAIPIVGGFALSSELEDCAGVKSGTTTGVFDVDGDGKADVVSSSVSAPGQMSMARLVGSSGVPGAPDAGRLIHVDNGYGARTTVTYRSAKDDATTLHQLPFPEIVVAEVSTSGTLGLGGTLASTLYAYGGAELVFDPALDVFTFRGYRRAVELHIPTGETAGIATISDTYGPATTLDPFGVLGPSGAPIATTASQRYRSYMRAGRPSDVTVVSGALGSDPWALLATNVVTDPRRIGATHFEWDSRSLATSTDPAGAETCFEMVLPYDDTGSAGYASGNGTYDLCTTHGFAFGSSVDSWRGDPGAAPPSSANVETRTEVRAIDDLGRVLTEANLNDVHRTDDDLCIETTFATPTGANERVLVAVSSRQVTNCGAVIYARELRSYDKLAFGSVSSGFLTAHLTERRDGTGARLGTIKEFEASYDAFGNPIAFTTKREDGAAHNTSIRYDGFGMAPVQISTTATGTSGTSVSVSRDVALNVLATTDANGTVSGTTYDGFDRPVLSTVTPPVGPSGALSVMTYIGFAIGDPPGRSVVQTVFTDPVDPASAPTAPGRARTTYLDELSRPTETVLALGSDYPDGRLIVGFRTYDTFGRVAFEADPARPNHHNSFTGAYGTTRFFNADGTPSCSVRATGRQAAVTRVTDETNEIFPTCYSRTFQNNTEVVSIQDAASLLGASPQAGVMKTAYASATGRVLTRSTWQGGTRLEHATFDHDPLGRLVGMTRYQDAATGAKPVTWSWRFDSLGQILELDEPDSVPQLNTYSNWGELLSVTRVLSMSATTAIVKKYDGLGRLIHSEQQDNGVADAATVNNYLYDQPVSIAPQVNPTNVLGRLAQAVSPTGAEALSYDSFGEVNARVFTDAQGGMYVEKHSFHGDGSPATLDLFLPDTGYADEHVEYQYDSAARGRSVTYANGANTQNLFGATTIDSFGRVREAQYGPTTYAASYADLGRRLMTQASVSSPLGSRSIGYQSYDPIGRERARSETSSSSSAGTATSSTYDALGRLATSVQTSGTATNFNQQFTYDPLGNIQSIVNAGASAAMNTTLTYAATDRDRICRIAYDSDTATTCNVVYDQLGDIISQPTRAGSRQLTYFADGNVRSVTAGAGVAQFRYDAFGEVQELDLTGGESPDTRHDRRYGGLISWRDEAGAPVLSRAIPGPSGLVATRHGAGGSWVFEFGEARGNRFFTDETGAFVQDVAYRPYGEATSTGAQPGSHAYSNHQWNGGDALVALGLSQLGARLYDPAIGRFLSRDPLLLPRTAATTNPYAFAHNDPINHSDPSGLDPEQDELPPGSNPPFTPIGGPANWDSLPWPIAVTLHHGSRGPYYGSSGSGSGGGGGGGAPAPVATDLARSADLAQSVGHIALQAAANQDRLSVSSQVADGLWDTVKTIGYPIEWAGHLFDDVAMSDGYMLLQDLGEPVNGLSHFLAYPVDTICANGCIRGVVGIAGPAVVEGGLARLGGGLGGASEASASAEARPQYVPKGADGSPSQLPHGPNGELAPSSTAPHSQIGWRDGRRGGYVQTREFGSNGQPIKQVDWTDHGRSALHSDPHVHDYVPNPTGGTPQHGPARFPRPGEL